jgi:hypothetical protein
MVYNTSEYWGFGLFHRHVFYRTLKQHVSVTGCVPVPKCEVSETPTQLVESERSNFQFWLSIW